MSSRQPKPMLPIPRTGSGDSIDAAVKDPDSAVFDSAESRIHRFGFKVYLVLCMIVVGGCSFAAIGLFSEMGCSHSCLEFLQEKHTYRFVCLVVMLLVLLALYLLDFFLPPHLPGLFFTLSEDYRAIGRFFLFVAAVAMLAAGYLSAHIYATIPLVITIFLSPTFVLLLRLASMPRERFQRRKPSELLEASARPGEQLEGDARFKDRMEMLKMLTGDEEDQRNFYMAAMWAFAIICVACFAVWIPWAFLDEEEVQQSIEAASPGKERELVFVRWATPLATAVANFVFFCFAGLRVALHRAYSATDEVKNRLLVSYNTVMNEELMNHRMAMLKKQLESGGLTPHTILKTTADRQQQYLVQHISHMRQLSNMVKSMGCAFIALIGAFYVAFQMTAADSHIAAMVQGALSACFVTFVAFVFVSFNRLWQNTSVWLADLPLWKGLIAFIESDAMKATMVCVMAPVLPFVAAISWLNQRVRRCRRLSDKRQCLTERVQNWLASLREWDWVHVILLCYVIVTVIITMPRLIPVLLNVLLSWLSYVMDVMGMGFVGVTAMTFGAGMVLFMLPPVPGPPIYLFGGIMITKKCPWGFTAGSITCITVCFLLKLTACAIQQKLIGERLGSSQWVRQNCRVHKPFMRAVESVLRRPGLSFGKCMILCGGPDWPVSVLAGILRLSLAQCLLGTCPVLFSVVPLSLTGSFWFKQQEDQREIWIRSAKLMFSLTMLVSVVFWAGMAWAIQDEFDKNYVQLTKPMAEYVDLDWLDHREEELVRRCQVKWVDLPLWVKLPYASGIFCLMAIGQLFYWARNACFGAFKITDDIRTFKLTGEDGLIRPLGLLGLELAAASYIGLALFLCWRARRNRLQAKEVLLELSLVEASWKAQRLREAQGIGLPVSPRTPVRSLGSEENWVNPQNPVSHTRIPTSPFSSPNKIQVEATVERRGASSVLPPRDDAQQGTCNVAGIVASIEATNATAGVAASGPSAQTRGREASAIGFGELSKLQPLTYGKEGIEDLVPGACHDTRVMSEDVVLEAGGRGCCQPFCGSGKGLCSL